MADNAARAFAIAQLSVGFLLFCSGIGEQVVGKLISKRLYVGIVAGIWVSRSGVLSNVMFCDSRTCRHHMIYKEIYSTKLLRILT